MKSVKKAKLLWLCLGISSLVIGISALVFVAVFGLKLMYIPMTVSVALVAYGAYSAVFYFKRFVTVRLYGRIIDAGSQINGKALIANYLNMKEEAFSSVLDKAIKEGFISKEFLY